jgi:mannose-6-phosphate isomerase-like protein (cupin superfamily)
MEKNKFGDIEILTPMCNPSTITDGRGAIFSWIPEDAIKEFTMLFFLPGKVRGNHYHPEFSEYFLVVDGEVALFTVNPVTGKQIVMLCGKGFCFRTPSGVPHAVQAISSATCISLITLPWDKAENPIVYVDLIPLDSKESKITEVGKDDDIAARDLLD